MSMYTTAKSLCELFDVEFKPEDYTDYGPNITPFKRNELPSWNKGLNLTKEHKKGISDSLFGKVSPNKGKILSDRWRNNMSKAQIGISKSDKHKSILGKHLNSLPKLVCPHCGKEGRMAPMKRWHFDNCKIVV